MDGQVAPLILAQLADALPNDRQEKTRRVAGFSRTMSDSMSD
jgi:hypothetical protein